MGQTSKISTDYLLTRMNSICRRLNTSSRQNGIDIISVWWHEGNSFSSCMGSGAPWFELVMWLTTSCVWRPLATSGPCANKTHQTNDNNISKIALILGVYCLAILCQFRPNIDIQYQQKVEHLTLLVLRYLNVADDIGWLLKTLLPIILHELCILTRRVFNVSELDSWEI